MGQLCKQEKKRYLEQIFNFAFGMLKSLAHADLSGMSYKIDLKKKKYIYIYIHTHTYIFFTGRRGLRFCIGEGLLNVTARTDPGVCQPPIPPSPLKRAHFGGRKCFPLAEYWQSQDSETSLASSETGGVTSELSGS